MYLGTKNKKINEDDKDILYRRISRKAFILGAKLNNIEENVDKQNILGALNLLNQAQIILKQDRKESLRLLNMANRLAQV